MAPMMICLFLFEMLLAGHATADPNEAMEIGKAMSKFSSAGHMRRPVAQGIAAPLVSDGLQPVMVKTLADLEARSQAMQAEYQHLRARIQKISQADDQASLGSATSFNWLAGFIASVGLASFVGVAAVRKYFSHEQSASGSQISMVSQPLRPAQPTPRAAVYASAVNETDVTKMDGITLPIGFFDPLGFSKGASPEAMKWYREAEIKHGRVAMAAFVGFLVNYQGITFPANLTLSGEKFSSLGTGSPFLAWDNVSDKGKWSILGFIGLLEVLGEAEKPHYMRGGKSGTHDLVWYFGSKYLSGKSEEQRQMKRNAEINNGRLAMIGIMSFIAASTVPGSVPYFTEDLTQYSGSVWAPF